ncbi:Gfo/Idh/MocA family protein [Algicella marina]|uniref:Gfo/Idh/MocA family oxidoreductase n=1 Tax=Algicella marina TaxID=2683284 RepID=A0A6P1T579_9RHOB|nr:Gfo/Idh/MocA family oxidoreductase [Algicella marina]QHQ37187.1 gfo/Idh/MocA family oxidoreductase [Algicella marina]
MFRWGVLSTAKIGREHLIPAFVDAENGVLSAIASRDESRAAKLAARFGAPHVFGSYEAMLASDVIDGVYIPLPTSQHAEWTIKAADAGKHVLCEKPIVLKASEIDALIEARDRNGVTVSEAFMVTYHPQWKKVKQLLHDGAIGRLRHVQGAFSYYNVDETNMRNVPELGGGALPDIGVYPTVTTRFATGLEPKRVSAEVERDPKFGTDIYARVAADFGEFRMDFYVATQMAARQEMVFHGEKGWIRVRTPFNAGLYGADVVELHDQNRGHDEVFRFTGTRQYVLEVEAFARAVAGDGEVFSLEDSRRNQKFIDAVYAAGEAGGWVDV